MKPHTGRLLITCPDASGVVAAVAGFLAGRGANILESDHHTDPDTRRFSMRLEFEPGPGSRDDLAAAFAQMSDRLGARSRFEWSDRPRRVALLCSGQTHCLADVLWRASAGELPAQVAVVISNHTAAEGFAKQFGVPFHHLPVTPETKPQQEAAVADLVETADADCVVLARYMQILSPGFADRFAGRVINIHHGFLPAFAGAKPYHQAFAKGVKLIGATAHYVTAELDQGPIIAQRTAPVTHRDTVDDLVRKGRDLERIVLAEAVRLHLEDKVVTVEDKTVVFD